VDDLAKSMGWPPVPQPAVEAQSLLALLGQGLSLVQAAQRLHLSRRTATRRLADIRLALGAGTTAEAIRLAAEPSGPSLIESLSPRERQTMELVGLGLTSGDIAAKLGVTRVTVDSFVRSARVKLGASTRIEVIAKLARGEPED